MEYKSLGKSLKFYLSDRVLIAWGDIIPEEEGAIVLTRDSLVIYSEVTDSIASRIKIKEEVAQVWTQEVKGRSLVTFEFKVPGWKSMSLVVANIETFKAFGL
jgi:hypothetical protein